VQKSLEFLGLCCLDLEFTDDEDATPAPPPPPPQEGKTQEKYKEGKQIAAVARPDLSDCARATITLVHDYGKHLRQDHWLACYARQCA
jgi:hypothetical protein